MSLIVKNSRRHGTEVRVLLPHPTNLPGLKELEADLVETGGFVVE